MTGIFKSILIVFYDKSRKENETPFYNDMIQETLLQLSERALQSAKAKLQIHQIN